MMMMIRDVLKSR